jgi:hypothetical protein
MASVADDLAARRHDRAVVAATLVSARRARYGESAEPLSSHGRRAPAVEQRGEFATVVPG